MADEKKNEQPEPVEVPQGFYSQTWFTPQGRMRLINGVWVAEAPEEAPPSSSIRAGQRKPRTMREKLALEAQEKEHKHEHA